MRKVCLFKKFPRQEIRWKYSVLLSEIVKTVFCMELLKQQTIDNHFMSV